MRVSAYKNRNPKPKADLNKSQDGPLEKSTDSVSSLARSSESNLSKSSENLAKSAESLSSSTEEKN